MIVTTSSDKEISLQELLKLLYDHFVTDFLFILLLLTIRVRIVGTFELFLWVEALVLANSLLRKGLFFKSFRGLELAHCFEVYICFVVEEELI